MKPFLHHNFFWILLYLMAILLSYVHGQDIVELPDRCESCVIFARELEQIVYAFEKTKKVKKRDELTLIESLESVCSNMLQYKMHKEKHGLSRFQKIQSETMRTLHKLKDRGVKVELGMPYELWDEPTAEITSLKQQCELILEEYEGVIERWYYQKTRRPLQQFLCKERVLNGKDASCIKENQRSDL